MAASRHLKNQARNLFLEGKTSKEISELTGVPLSTVQRWITRFKRENVDVRGGEIAAPPEAPVSEPLPALKTVSNEQETGEQVETVLSCRVAARLLNLSELSLATVENILNNPDSSDVSKLRAVQIVGKWCGFEDSKSSLFGSVAKSAGVAFSLDSSDSQKLNIIPMSVIRKRNEEKGIQTKVANFRLG